MAAVVQPPLAPPWDGTGLRLVPAPSAPPYALRRLAAAAVAVLILLVGASAVRVAAAAVGAVAGPPPPALPVPLPPATAPSHVVAPGDSYWSIAVSLRPAGDVRAVVDALVAANGSRPLQPGDRLVLPVP